MCFHHQGGPLYIEHFLKHLICPNFNKWTWNGIQWIVNSSVPEIPNLSGDFTTLHYKFTQNGIIKYHWFPVVLNTINTTYCKVWHFNGSMWNEIHGGNLGEFPSNVDNYYRFYYHFPICC